MEVWVLYQGVNHVVYHGEGSYTEFACGMDAVEPVRASDPLLPKCPVCLRRLRTHIELTERV